MPARRGLLDGDDAVGLLGILLDHDRVCAFRHRRSREDAHGFTLTDALLEASTRSRDANHLKPRGKGRDVGRAHRVTIHGRGSEGRLGDPRRKVLGDHAALPIFERDALGPERGEPIEHAGKSLID
jgi:hypothetical protein